MFADPWWDLRGGEPAAVEQRSGLKARLAIEVGVGHPLHGQDIDVVARSQASDDVVVSISGGGWAVVHLTWSRTAESPPWPRTTFYADSAALELGLDTSG
ncbi:hypothetical protein [Asanoa ishikariensis]|uniref:hypothetical protein n=1 Tax=Asanoa ishikariensis TaxID=137265 RepID=UPI001EF24D92|nr:hypothetical protein [Asanoa ishikariensis]